MSGHKKPNKSVHTVTTRTVIMRCEDSKLSIFVLATVLLIFNVPASEASFACSFNGNGTCSVSTNTDGYLGELAANNQSIEWRVRPQNIGFMYYFRTSNEGGNLGIRGIVKWKIHLKNWTENETNVEGFLVLLLDHDTNATVTSYEIKVTEPFEEFLTKHEMMEVRLELDDVLRFGRRYDAKINMLPIGKQASAISYLSIMENPDGAPCSAKKGLAERWAPHVMVDVFEASREIEISWQPAPSELCIKTYEVVLQSREGDILNSSEIEVHSGQKLANASFGKISKDQLFQVKIRAKDSSDGGCACGNCNCITDKTKFFMISEFAKTIPNITTTPKPIQETSEQSTGIPVFSICLILVIVISFVFLCVCVICPKTYAAILKRRVALEIVTTPEFSKRKIRPRKNFKVMLVCPEITGRDYDLMVRISEALKCSSNEVVCDRWKESFPEAEENVFHWAYEQIRKAEKIIIFYSTTQIDGKGVFSLVNTFFPSTDSRLVHVALSSEVQRNRPLEVEYVMPRDQKLLEDAFDIEIAEPLVIDIPNSIVIEEPNFNSNSCESIGDGSSPDSTKTHSTDSGVSSMSSNSSGSDERLVEPAQVQLQTAINVDIEEVNVESRPLLMHSITG